MLVVAIVNRAALKAQKALQPVSIIVATWLRALFDGDCFDTLQPSTDSENLIYYRHGTLWEKYRFAERCTWQGFWTGQAHYLCRGNGHLPGGADEIGAQASENLIYFAVEKNP